MTKTILLSLVAASVLFTACDQKAKDSVAEAASSVTSSVKDAASSAVEKAGDLKDAAVEKASEVTEVAKEKAANAIDATKEAAADAVEKAGDLKDAAVEKAAEATDAVKEKVADATDASADNEAGKAAYAKCAGCHGVDGKTQALGKSAVVAGQSAADLEAALNGYKEGTRNVSGMGTLMKGQVASMSEDDIKAVAAYMSGL